MWVSLARMGGKAHVGRMAKLDSQDGLVTAVSLEMQVPIAMDHKEPEETKDKLELTEIQEWMAFQEYLGNRDFKVQMEKMATMENLELMARKDPLGTQAALASLECHVVARQ
jgi:hypothetical protein